MCGISGIIDFKKKSTLNILTEMTDTMYHRGPDGFGYEFYNRDDYQIGFGHRRLSIIDLSENGKQPMIYKQLTIVFNGEVYNYQEIKDELNRLGHNFVSSSDTEMILHAYEQWGKKCIDKFIGMFSIVIYDDEKQEVFCARDRAGIKPFFYYYKDDLFLFSSELKAFHKHPRFKKDINLDAVGLFLQFGNVPTPYCIFNDCFKLKPGHYMTFDLKNKSLIEQCYWNVYDSYNQPKLDISFEEAKNETKKILKSAAQYRMIADVPVGVFLSGGYDSASLVALLQENSNSQLKTFTIGVPDIGLNESEYANDVAKYLGTNHHEYFCSHEEALELIDDLPFYYDEPFADSSAIPTTLVSKIAKKHVTVALSADAGDEVFAGYNRYDYIMKFGDKINKIPNFARNISAGLMDVISPNKIPYFKDKYNFVERYDKLKRILRNPSPHEIMMSMSSQFTQSELNNILISKTNQLYTHYFSEELLDNYKTPLSYMMAIDYQTYLVDDILQKVDRASMSVSLEGREPYLDHRIIEFAAKLPDSFKYFNGTKKHILKEIVHDMIPKKLMDRPKMGFAIPYDDWMLNELKEKVHYYLDSEKIKQQGIFKVQYIENLKDTFFSGKKEKALKIWYILMFQMWYEKWM